MLGLSLLLMGAFRRPATPNTFSDELRKHCVQLVKRQDQQAACARNGDASVVENAFISPGLPAGDAALRASVHSSIRSARVLLLPYLLKQAQGARAPVFRSCRIRDLAALLRILELLSSTRVTAVRCSDGTCGRSCVCCLWPHFDECCVWLNADEAEAQRAAAERAALEEQQQTKALRQREAEALRQREAEAQTRDVDEVQTRAADEAQQQPQMNAWTQLITFTDIEPKFRRRKWSENTWRQYRCYCVSALSGADACFSSPATMLQVVERAIATNSKNDTQRSALNALRCFLQTLVMA